jgi:hypothetical protein
MAKTTMDSTLSKSPYFRKQIAIPQDHGSWVFILSPLLIGIALGGWSNGMLFLVLSVTAGFLIRQPMTIWIKTLSGRRSERDKPAAIFWSVIYALLGLAGILGLVLAGHAYVLVLALPGVPVFAWHLWLVSRRAERRQIGVEIVAVGVLSLAAPGAYWVGQGQPDMLGIWLWLLVWFQSAASIVYAYLRLAQRALKQAPDLAGRLRMGARALAYTTFNLAAVSLFVLAGYLPPLLPVAYGLQWLESVYGTLRPAVGLKPTQIGIRQLIVSSLFTLLFILAWWLPA